MELPMLEPRSCGTCTKCCDGNLKAEIYGHKMTPGRPCHFVATGQGCTIYADRPVSPCQEYKCLWLMNREVPEWLKPSLTDIIIDNQTINGIDYVRAIEAGSNMNAEVLTWFIQFAIKNGYNAMWKVKGTSFWIGSPEFNAAMELEK